MPIDFSEENGGRWLAVHCHGTVTKADYTAFAAAFERLVQAHGKLRVLFDLTGFHGWEVGALWEEIKFDVKHYADIERVATIGDKQWEQYLTAFFKPFTKATVRYYDQAEAAAARIWLQEA